MWPWPLTNVSESAICELDNHAKQLFKRADTKYTVQSKYVWP